MKLSLIVIFLILLYLFPTQIHQLYETVYGKVIIYIALILLACEDRIGGLLLIGVFLYTMHPIQAPNRIGFGNQHPLQRSYTTLVDLEQNLKPMDPKI